MVRWNYESKAIKSTGYEDVLPELKKFKHEDFIVASEAEQEKMIDEVFKIYRSKNIFPITYFNEKGIEAEIKKTIEKVEVFDGEVLNIRSTAGSNLCKFMMPNLFDVKVRGKDTQLDRFYEDSRLKYAIKFALKHDRGCMPAQLQGAIRMTGGVATNFLPIRAKALYEYYTPENGVILDYAHGFGGRMLGALSSKKNYKYIGIDPNTETHDNVQRLGEAIEKVTGRTDSFELHCIGSELYEGEPESVDFAFSSPPYFNLERYTEEETQSYNKYEELDAWLEGYVRPTVKMLYKNLKPNAYYAVNIADFNLYNKRYRFVEDWRRISIEEGFTYVKNIPMKLMTRTGIGDVDKEEGIFLFQKIIE